MGRTFSKKKNVNQTFLKFLLFCSSKVSIFVFLVSVKLCQVYIFKNKDTLNLVVH